MRRSIRGEVADNGWVWGVLLTRDTRDTGSRHVTKHGAATAATSWHRDIVTCVTGQLTPGGSCGWHWARSLAPSPAVQWPHLQITPNFAFAFPSAGRSCCCGIFLAWPATIYANVCDDTAGCVVPGWWNVTQGGGGEVVVDTRFN